MFISITGDLGSGKSTIAKIFKEKYNFEHYSTGNVFREIAKEKGISVLELNKFAENDPTNEVDKLIDDKTVEYAKNNKDKDVIFDSRMAWHFAPNSFKVYVTVDIDIAADRVLNSARGETEKYLDKKSAIESLLKRKEIEDKRYNKLYNVDCQDKLNYDYIVDSSYTTPEELAKMILQEAKKTNKLK